MPDPNPTRPNWEQPLWAFLRLIRKRTLTRTHKWADPDWAEYTSCRGVLDSLLIRHACHAADDQQKIRVIAERVRRSFYAKAFRKISDRDFEKHLPRKLWDGATVALWLFEQTKREEYALRRLPPERLTQVEAELGVAHLWTEDPPKIENEGLVGAPKSRCGRRDSEAEQCARSCDFLYLQRQQFKQEDIADALGIDRGKVSYWIGECQESARKNLEQQKPKAAPHQLKTRHG